MELLIKNWTKEQVNDMFIQEDFFKHLKLYDGVAETLNKLKTDGHYIEAVTCHDIRGIAYKMNWIKENLPMFDAITILPLGKNLKLDKSEIQGCLIIDDVPSVLETSPCKYKLLYGTYSWNKECYTYPRVDNWDEVYEYINSISE